jgi:hypothetical protein
MAVEALLVGANREATTWSNVTPNFGLLDFGLTLGTQIEPQPFQTATEMPAGAHLRWALPDALTHGNQGQAVARAILDGGGVGRIEVLQPSFGYDPAAPPFVTFSGGGGTGARAEAQVSATGEVTAVNVTSPGVGYEEPPTVAIGSSDEIRYPQAPNRWFVLRSHVDEEGKTVGLKSWVVVSDELSSNQYGRVVEGPISKDLEPQLKNGPVSAPLRQALEQDLGLTIESTASLSFNRDAGAWYLRNGTFFYSLVARDADIQVLGYAAVSWPQNLDEPYNNSNWPLWRYIGRAYPYPIWDGANPPESESNLTALGPGDPVFSAAYPNSRSVFGFYDDLRELPQGGEVTYMVAGWFADPAENPLFGADTAAVWEERMAELRWCLQEDPGGFPAGSLCDAPGEAEPEEDPTLPTDILCQGMVYGVDWKGPSADYPSGVPEGTPEIAVGNTSAEAISALVARDLAEEGDTITPDGIGIEELFEAFIYDALDVLQQPDGVVKLEQILHDHTFGRRPAGAIFQVQLRDSQRAEERDANTSGEPFPEPVGQALTAVNDLQLRLNTEENNLQSLQWELYSAWFRKALLDFSPLMAQGADVSRVLDEVFTRFEGTALTLPREELDRRLRAAANRGVASNGITTQEAIEVIERLEGMVREAKDQRSSTEQQRDAAAMNLQQQVDQLMPSYQVVLAPAAGYWQGNDPVVLFAGDGVQRSFAHGEDAALADGESLPCRVTGQTITALTTPVPGYENQTITQPQLQVYYGQFPPGPPIPADVEALFIETLLLDTNMDRLMSLSAWKLAGVDNPNEQQIAAVAQSIEQIQTAPFNGYLYRDLRALHPALRPQRLAVAAGLTGVYPYKLAVDPWAQPWAPIYVQWDVFWNASARIPGELKICDTSGPSCGEKWMFTETDYRWNTQFQPGVPGDPKFRYSGRTVLTPNTPENLAQRLLEYIEDHPDSPYLQELMAIYEQLKNLDILSQSLSGFSNSLVMRRETLQMPVVDFFNPDIGTQVKAAIDGQNQASPLPDNGYSPLRAGHCKIVRLWVVDAFGQSQRLVDEGQQYEPVLSKPLITEGHPSLIQLTPRVVQPSRLMVEWIDSRDDQVITTSDPATSPLIGWIVPNYFDSSLMVYDEVGGSVGALQLLDGALGGDGSAVRWVETPGTTTALGAQPSLDDPTLNPHLKSFINGLLHFGGVGQHALSDFIAVLNRTLSTIVLTGSAANYGNLPVLVGRPMALVRMAMKVDLEGLPDYNESWDAMKKFYQTSQFVSDGFLDVELPVQIGDVRQQRDGVVGYFLSDNYQRFNSKLLEAPVQRSNYIQYQQRVRLTANPAADPTYVTLVADPRAPIHLLADFVPQIERDLPTAGVAEALAAIDLTFRVGPVLAEQGAFQVPLPADIHGTWSWVTQPNVTVWSPPQEIQGQDSIARFPEAPYRINDGWLKLSEAFGDGTKK